MKTKRRTIRGIAAAAVISTAALALTACGIPYDGNTTGCTVTGKYTAVVDKKSQNRLETSCGVFQVSDEFVKGQWNSADTYAGIQIGKTYDFDAYGYRNGFLSLFPNVVSYAEVAQ